MRKILICSAQPERGTRLEEALRGAQASVKFVTTYEHALEWMKQRTFDLLIVEDYLPSNKLRTLGFSLWSTNSSAQAFILPAEEEFRESPAFYKVLGFEPTEDETLIQKILSDITSGSSLPQKQSNNDFPILVVEDLDSPRDIICIFIESLGYPNVRGCESASEALSILESDPSAYKCIVSDIKMPKITGKEFVEIVRAHDRLRHLPFIVLTAYGTLDMLVDCLHLGASGFLVKPPKKEDMHRELARAVRIANNQESPRLASHQEAEYIRRMVEERKVV
jgi:two-component system chemotaxis response regulator CheY